MRLGRAAAFALQPLLEMHLGVPLLLVRARELAAADVAGEGLLARVRAYVRRQVVGAAEGAHADAALEGLLPRVDAYVARQLVRAREAPVAAVHGARVRPLVHRRLAGPVGVLARLDGHQPQRLRALLVHLRQDLVALAGGGVVLGQLHGPVAGRRGVGLALGQARRAGRGLRRRLVLLLPVLLRAVLAGRGARQLRLRAVGGLAVGRRQQVDALLVLGEVALVAGAGAGRQQPLQRRAGRALAGAGARARRRPVQRRARAGRVAGLLGARARRQRRLVLVPPRRAAQRQLIAWQSTYNNRCLVSLMYYIT